MKKILLVTAAAACVSLLGTSVAHANVAFSQNVKAVGDAKIVHNFKDYHKVTVPSICNKGGCIGGYTYDAVAKGKATVRLTTFKVSEGIKKYDYYLLDYDITLSSRAGGSKAGSIPVGVNSYGTKLYDRVDTRSVKAAGSKCKSVDITLSTPWPVVGASGTVAQATFCNKKAALSHTKSGVASTYKATVIRDISHATIQRWVKVKAHAHPKFKTAITFPTDTCTSTFKVHTTTLCNGYKNSSVTKVKKIGTTG